MGRSTWYSKKTTERRNCIFADYNELLEKQLSKGLIYATLALKYHVTENTIRSDLKAIQHEQT